MRSRIATILVAIVVAGASGVVVPSGAWAAPADAPQNVVASPGNTGGTVSVTWGAATPSLGVTLLGYTVEMRDSGGSPIVSTRTDAPASSLGPVTISGLTNGASYTAVVYSRYSSGSVASDPSATVIPFTVPAAPAAPSASRLAAGSVRVTWTAPSDTGGRAVTSYTVTCTPACTPTTSASLTADLVGLTNSESYTFKVAATNARGSSTPSPASTAVTPYGPPTAPQNVQGTRGNAQLTITWQEPNSDGGSTISSYTATANPGGQQCTWNSGPLQCTITGLTNGTTYSVSVTASNANETPSPAGTVSNLTPATVPSAPVATAVAGDRQATVTWSVPSNGGSAITGYTATSSPAGKTCTGGASDTSCIVTDLSNGTAYTFTVTASNSTGTGTASAPTNSVTPNPAVSKPSVVRDVVATMTGSGAATVTWQAPTSNGGAAITQYELQYRVGTSGPWSNADDTRGPAALSYAFTGLTNGSNYFFRVAARNAGGLSSDWTAPAGPAIPGTVPGKVTGVTATPGPGQVSLSWVAPSANGYAILDYRVEYKLTPGASWTLVDDTSTSTAFTVTGLTNDAQYQFRVRAHNALGSGDYSDVATATPTASSSSPSPTSSPTASPSPSPSPTKSPSPSPTPTISPTPTPKPSPTGEIDAPKRVIAEPGDRVKVTLEPTEPLKASTLRAIIVVDGVRRALNATFRSVRGEILMTFTALRKPGNYRILIGQRSQGEFAVLGETRLVVRKRRSRA